MVDKSDVDGNDVDKSDVGTSTAAVPKGWSNRTYEGEK